MIEMSNNTDSGAADRVRLRLVALEDLPALAILDKEIFRDLAYSMHLLRTFYELCRSTWYVADHNGDLAGYALVGLSAYSRDGWLLGLAVGNRYRGRGLGGELMSRALLTMMEHDVINAYLTVRPQNDTARRIYDKFEFVQHGETVPDYYGNGEPRAVLHRSLQANPYRVEN